MELNEIVRALRRWWYLVAVTTVVAAAVAGGLTAMRPPMYTATAQGIVAVSDPQTRPPYALASGAQYILDRMTSYAELGVTTPVLTPVVANLNLDETPLSLSGRISSHSVVGKAVLDVAVTYNNPKTAAAIADHVLTGIGQSVATLERGNIELKPLGLAGIPTAASNQAVAVTTAVAAVGGLVLGCLIAVGLHLLSGLGQRRRARYVSSLAEKYQ